MVIATFWERPRPGLLCKSLAALTLGMVLARPTATAREGAAPRRLDRSSEAVSQAEAISEGIGGLLMSTVDPGMTRVKQEDSGGGTVPKVSFAEAGMKPGEQARPGSTVVLDIADGEAEQARAYRWVQVEGPRVALKGADRRTVEVEIPDGADRLSFLRIESGVARVRIVRFVIPVARSPGSGSVLAESGSALAESGSALAHAGDDQVGLVGHRVTLNGSKSLPESGAVFRWLQVSGPTILAPQQEGKYFSFVPTAQGLYQFALVVGTGQEISEPDGVSVLVGSAPSGSGLSPSAMDPRAVAGAVGGAGRWADRPELAEGSAAPMTSLTSPEALIVATLPDLPDGARLAGEVADVFGAVADRSSLYSSFGDAQSELSRRLDVVIPVDPSQRLSWSQRLLQPLTGYTIAQMQVVGLDVRQPASMAQTLTPEQRERMEGQFQVLARAFRKASEGASR